MYPLLLAAFLEVCLPIAQTTDNAPVALIRSHSGGRWDAHGTPLERTWVKLGSPAAAGATTLVLSQPVPGWRVGDRLIVTATSRQAARDDSKIPHVSEQPQTEERLIRSIEGSVLTLDAPLKLA